jgi:hypothetical protein
MKPLLTHWARSCVSSNACDRSGIATLTTVDDMIEAITPTITVTSSSQRWRAPYFARSAASDPGSRAVACGGLDIVRTVKGSQDSRWTSWRAHAAEVLSVVIAALCTSGRIPCPLPRG